MLTVIIIKTLKIYIQNSHDNKTLKIIIHSKHIDKMALTVSSLFTIKEKWKIITKVNLTIIRHGDTHTFTYII